MLKIYHKSYFSLRTAITWLIESRTYGGVRDHLSPEEYYKIHGMKKPGKIFTYFVKPFEIFLDMGKEVVDTFKPYKGYYQSTRDVLIPLRGLKNLLKGLLDVTLALVYLALAPAVFTISLLLTIVGGIFSGSSNFTIGALVVTGVTGAGFGVAISDIARGLSDIVKGVTQLAATPLVWAIKMPLRGLITLFAGAPKIEDSATIKHLAEDGLLGIRDNDEKKSRAAVNAMHHKFQCAAKKGQQTAISPVTERALYNQNRYSEYLALFIPTTSTQRDFMLFAREAQQKMEPRLPEDVTNHMGKSGSGRKENR
jgi:hypothetical protein